MKVSGILAAGYERDLSPKVRGVLDAYAAGVNRYAALHPEKVAKGLLPVTGRDIYGRSEPDGRLHAVNGDCYLMFIDWDAKGRLTSRSIHQFGSATLDTTSPHYADQAALFAPTRPSLCCSPRLSSRVMWSGPTGPGAAS